MISNNNETINAMINRFNEKQKSNKRQFLKDNHRSLFIDFYFKNFRKNIQSD